MSDEAQILDRLHDLGFRVTGPRRRVVAAVLACRDPFTAEDLYDQLRADGQPVGRATVFRTLDLLVSLRVLDRVHRPDGCHSYVASGPGHRHHLICSACGAVVEFHGCNVGELFADLADRTRFRIDGHWLEVFGVCERCQRAAD